MKVVEEITFKMIDGSNRKQVSNISLKPTQTDVIESVEEWLKRSRRIRTVASCSYLY